MSTTPQSYDLIIIGGGPGGYPAAVAAAAKGRKVALVERAQLGGTCLNRGCIPTKTLCATAAAALAVAEAPKFGVDLDVASVRIDYARAAARKDAVVGQLRQGVEGLLKEVDVIAGEAVVTAAVPPTVEVDGRALTAPQVIIATGSEPAVLPVEGAADTLSSDDLLSLTELPASLAVIGGGVIGLEFASIYCALGVKVSVVEYCPEVLPAMDAEVAKRLRTALKRRGVEFFVGARVTAVRQGGTAVEFEQKGKTRTVEAERVLMAVGRRAVLPRGLEAAGIEVGRKGIVADPATLATNVAGFYAVGDCNGLCQLAHAATAQGLRAVGEPVALEPVPAAVFTMPEMAAVGLTEAQAADAGIDVRIGKATFRANGKAMAMDETDGMVKVVADAATGRLLGATVMGPHAADLVHELSTAMTHSLTAPQVAGAVHAHPTLSEALVQALEAVG